VSPASLTCLCVLALVLAALVRSRVAPDVVLLGGLTLLMSVPLPDGQGGWRLGVLEVQEALAGFANPGLVTVGALFVVSAGVRETGVIDALARGGLGRPRSQRRALLRVSAPVVCLSAVLNNTPVVAMLIPAVRDWARRVGIAPSKLMLPLSYAAILGGTCTLIGTSTNLVVAGLAEEHTALGSLPLLGITWLGLPCAIFGIAYLLLFGPKLLPERGSATSALGDAREYTAEMLVPEGSSLAGRTVEAAGLRALPGAYLVEIERQGDLIVAPGPTQALHAGDRLVFTGVVGSIKELQTICGLLPATDQIFKLDEPRPNRALVEAVVSNTSPLVGRTIKAARFRTLYNAVIIAVARNGERAQGKVGDIVILPGDTLLLEARRSFVEQHHNDRDFFLVSQLEDSTPRRHQHARAALVILAAMVASAASGILSMLHASLLAAGAMLMARCTSTRAARESVEWSVLLVIGAAFGIGAAMEKSGLAALLIERVLGLSGGHPLAVLAAMYLVTTVLTEVISNNAAVALVFPVAIGAAARLGVSVEPFVYSLMMAGSASFCTPIGYQTNLMVMGPGGYRFTDYLKIGLPLNIGLGLLTVLLAPLIWPF